MKYFTLLLLAFALLSSCKNENTLRDNSTTATPSATAPVAPAQSPTAANVAGGAHYVCTLTGCTGQGADGAGNCSVCGNALSHNQAFHNTPAAGQTNTNSSGGLSPLFTNPSTPAGTTTTPNIPTPPAEPAQNANGVWHYTCSNGCAGGAGSAIACASCGSTLAHNAAYH